MKFGHAAVKRSLRQSTSCRKSRQEKADVSLLAVNEALDAWTRKTFKDVAKAMRIVEKQERNTAFAKFSKEAALSVGKELDVRAVLEDKNSKDFEKIIKAMEEEALRVMVVDEKLRPDGRKADEIRDLVEGRLPAARVRGTGLFQRGQTQVLTAATLGSIGDEQRLDGIMAIPNKRYMHYYNFPPYSVGETHDAWPRPARDRSRSPRGARAGAGPAAAGRVSLHDAPDQRSAGIQRLVVDGVDLRLDALADGCRRSDSEARGRGIT